MNMTSPQGKHWACSETNIMKNLLEKIEFVFGKEGLSYSEILNIFLSEVKQGISCLIIWFS